MKVFLIRLLRFSVFSIIISASLFFIILAAYLYRINKLKLDDNIDTLILGDSQPQTAINDSLLKNSVNYSNNSEHYLLSYNVLELIVKNNPQIKNLILGCSFHNISAFYEKCLYNEGNKANAISNMLCSRYFSMLDNKSKLLMIENNFPGVIKSFHQIVWNMVSSFTGNYSNYQDYAFVGKYYPGIKRTLNDEILKASITWHFYSDTTETEVEDFSPLQIEYLKKIISFCKENNIRVFLLNTPVHEDYLKRIPPKFITGYYSLMKELEAQGNITLLDYPDYKLPDEYFGDCNHLNREGASVFTPEVELRLNNKR
jgi:hypothetical protein